MTNKNNNFDKTTIILLGLLVLLLVFSIPLFMNNSKINNITKDLDIIETFSNCNKQHFGNKEYFGTKKNYEPFNTLKRKKIVNNPIIHTKKRKEEFKTDDTKLELYTMSGCGHCVDFKTTWGKIKTHPESHAKKPGFKMLYY